MPLKKYMIRNLKRSAICLAALSSFGCGVTDFLNTAKLPSGTTDPKSLQNERAALSLYNTAVNQLNGVVSGGESYMTLTGLLSGELQYYYATTSSPTFGKTQIPFDKRTMSGSENPITFLFGQLHNLRVYAVHASDYLRAYATDTLSTSYLANAKAMEAYSIILLGEGFCSGMPLSMPGLSTNYILSRGYSLEELMKRVLAITDTAIQLSSDNANVKNFSLVLRSRAHLNLGDLDSSAHFAAMVPKNFVYSVSPPGNYTSVFNLSPGSTSGYWNRKEMTNRKGGSPIDYLTSGDPRVAYRTLISGVKHPLRYDTIGLAATVIASGVETELNRAEAALSHGGIAEWLKILNDLRNNNTYTTAPNPATPGLVDTTWGAGYGAGLFLGSYKIKGLRPLSDPGSPTARLDLHFKEKAFWLFLTGHRQGDARRLIRQYNRTIAQVYPTGQWGIDPAQTFGEDVVIPTPPSEVMNNRFYSGCINKDA